MKIKEIVSETKEHIHLYWLLKSVDIQSLNTIFNELKSILRTTGDPTVKGTMIGMYSRLYELLSNPEWENLAYRDWETDRKSVV